MTKILITGKNSFIGTAVEKWLSVYSGQYSVDTIDMKNDDWKNMDFFGYDIIFHVAAIVHQKEKPAMAKIYHDVNCVMPVQVARKAKAEGVRQFIFMSTMSVYGISVGSIGPDTVEKPRTLYGKSKLNAEKDLKRLAGERFTVSIVRAPMVYGGLDCTGNYAKLTKMAKYVPFYPEYPNQRSFLHIDNLCEFVRQLVETGKQGVFFPQDDRYISSCDMVKDIAHELDKRIIFFRFMNPMIKMLSLKVKTFNRLFCDLTYDMKMSQYGDMKYIVRSRSNQG